MFFQNRLRGSGHGIAAARMDAKLNIAGWIGEQMGGVRWKYIIVFYLVTFMKGYRNIVVVISFLLK